jgi:hypothetical protein
MGVASLVAIISGIYLYSAGRHMFDRNRGERQANRGSSRQVSSVASDEDGSHVTPAVATGNRISDEVHGQAMAPTREVLAVPGTQSQPQAQPPALPQIPPQALAQASPARPATANPIGNRQMRVQARGIETKLRSGPGAEYPVIGTTSRGRFLVMDWNDHWFKVVPEGVTTAQAKPMWIRNDMVQVISAAN